MGVETWQRCLEDWQRLGPVDGVAIYERPQPQRKGLAAMLLHGGSAVAFVKLRPKTSTVLMRKAAALSRLESVDSSVVWVPRLIARSEVDDWQYVAMSTLPARAHKSPSNSDLAALTAEIRTALSSCPRFDEVLRTGSRCTVT